MEGDRSRQMQLARERLQARRNKRDEQLKETETAQPVDESLAETDDVIALQVSASLY